MIRRLRPARPADSPKVLSWRNSADARRNSFDPRPVARADHERWFAARLADPRTRLYIVDEAALGPVAQVRLDLLGSGRAEVSVTVEPRSQGRGIGTWSLRAAAAAARRGGLRRLVARIKTDNVASTVAFLKAGYVFVRAEKVRGAPAYRLELAL